MVKTIKQLMSGLLLVPALVLGFSLLADGTLTQPALAACGDVGDGIAGGADCGNADSTPDELTGGEGIFTQIVNVMLFIIGAVAVIMLIIGGIRYTTSNGDANQVTAAKNTILYAIIGIIVAILAYAIVNFVVTSFSEM